MSLRKYLLFDQIMGVYSCMIAMLRGGRRVFFAGNGGSAADAQHLKTVRVLRFGSLLYFSMPDPALRGARLKRSRSPGAGSSRPSDRWFADRDEMHVNIRTEAAWRFLCSDTGFVVVREGTDSPWDMPYFPGWPTFSQKLISNGNQRLLVPLFGMMSWSLADIHIGLWRKR